MISLDVNIKRPSVFYPIEIGQGLLDDFPSCSNRLERIINKASSIFVITHERLYSEFGYGKKLEKSLKEKNCKIKFSFLEEGENAKVWGNVEKFLAEMIHEGLDRSSLVIALGGGVIGDFAGFAASIYQRGIKFVQIPTTLLAMVDSSVGGKVAVNLGNAGKNLIGSFHQPSHVLIDLETLKTLPEKELKNGLGEVVKYAFLKGDSGEFYSFLKNNAQKILSLEDFNILSNTVFESVKTKADIVQKDETETSGLRALLNLGHTFAHSLEAESQYLIPHGEAVSIGIRLAGELALAKKIIDENYLNKITSLLDAFGLQKSISPEFNFSPEKLLGHFKHDKKTEGNKLKFIIPSARFSESEMLEDISEDILLKILSSKT